MNRNCLKCPASLACMTDTAWMRISGKLDVTVYMPDRILSTGEVLGESKRFCLAPLNCPRVRREYHPEETIPPDVIQASTIRLNKISAMKTVRIRKKARVPVGFRRDASRICEEDDE